MYHFVGANEMVKKRNRLSKKGTREKDQVNFANFVNFVKFATLSRQILESDKASKRQSDTAKVKLKEKKSDKEKRYAKESRHSKSSIKRGSAE